MVKPVQSNGFYVGWAVDPGQVPERVIARIQQLRAALGDSAKLVEMIDVRMESETRVDFIALRCSPANARALEATLIAKAGVRKEWSGVQDRLWLGTYELRVAPWQTATLA